MPPLDHTSASAAWCPTLRPDAVWTVVDDEAVVVAPGSGRAQVVNETGARVLALSDGTRTVLQIAGILAAEFEVEAAAALQDTLDFLGALAARGVVEPPGEET